MAISSNASTKTGSEVQLTEAPKYGLSSAGKRTQARINSSTGLESFAISRGLTPPKPSKFRSALETTGRVLNVGTAASAGAVRGALRPELSISQGIKEGLKKNIGFGDVIREDLGIKPTSRASKIAVGTISLVADIALDPMTYLTFGTGSAVKLGGKALSKPAQRVWLQAMKESNQSRRIVNTIISEAAGKGSKVATKNIAPGFARVSKGSLEAAKKVGISDFTLGSIARLGGDEIFDRGGIKFMGQTIVSGKRIRSLPGIKQVADFAATNQRIQDTKDTLGKLFVFNYGTNPKLQDILLTAGRVKQKAIQTTVREYEELFKRFKLNDSESLEFVRKGRENMIRVLEIEKKLKARSVEGARRIAKEKVAKETVQFSNPKIQGLFDEITKEGGHMERLQKLSGIKDEDAFPFYFPNIRLDNTASFASRRVGPKSAKENYKKTFRGRMTEDQIETNPLAAYSKRQIEVINERIDAETSNKIAGGFGRSFAGDAEAAEAGYVKFERKIPGGEKITTYIPDEISKEVSAFYEKGTGTIDKLARVSGLDWYTRIWKGYVTSLFPAFHIRNMTSNGFLNMAEFGTAAFNPKTGTFASQLVLNRGLGQKIMSRTGKRYTGKQILDLAEKEGILGTGAFGATEQLLEDASTKAFSGKGKSVVSRVAKQFGPEGKAFEAGRKVGGTIEDQAKLVGFITALAQGKTAKEAASQVRKAVFDYGRLTDFEKSVMRRLIPFYSFMRFNAESQVRSILTTPGRTAGQIDFVKNIGQTFGEPLTEEDLAGIPPYALSGLGIKWGKDKEGKDRFITGFGLPVEAFMETFSGEGNIMVDMFRDALNKLNPAVKAPLELSTGQNFFRGRAISDIYDAKDLKTIIDVMPKPVANELKELLEWSEQKDIPIYESGKITGYTTKYTANPYALYLLHNLPTARIQSTISGATDQTATPGQRALKIGTGVRMIVPDQEEQKFFRDLDRSKRLTAWLKRLGYAGEFTRAFIKKDANVDVGAADITTEE